MTYQHTQTKPTRKRLLSLLGAFLVVTVFPGNVWADELTVTVEGFADDLGQAVVEVYGSAEAYRDGTPETVRAAKIVAREVTMTLNGFDGTYALRAYHDRNSNGSLETLTPGLPLEPSGYSQGAWSEMARPDWALVTFSSDIEPPKQLIRLRTNAFVAFAQMLAVGLPALLAVFAGLALVRGLRGIVRGRRLGIRRRGIGFTRRRGIGFTRRGRVRFRRVGAGRVRLGPLISAVYPLADVGQAIGAAHDPGQLKVLISCR